MMQVWKFLIHKGVNVFAMPGIAARVISAGMDANGDACIWALVHPGEDPVQRGVIALWTGEDVDPMVVGGQPCLASFADRRGLVWHVFDLAGVR